MKNMIKIILIISIVITILTSMTTCYANSLEPPSIIIIVNNAPSDMDVKLNIGDKIIDSVRTDKVIESYFSFYSYEFVNNTDKYNNYTIEMTIGNNKSTIKFEKPLKSYDNIYTLDYKEGTIKTGKAPIRAVKLIGLRVILTLIIEAIVFFLFGFRKKRSWTIFLIVNLITQGVLNILLNTSTPINSYLIIGLLFGEIIILILELIAFLVLINEQSKLKTAIYVVVANLLSLVVGGYLITNLPI